VEGPLKSPRPTQRQPFPKAGGKGENQNESQTLGDEYILKICRHKFPKSPKNRCKHGSANLFLGDFGYEEKASLTKNENRFTIAWPCPKNSENV